MSFSTHFYLSLKSNTYCDKQVFTTFNTLDNYKSKYPHYNSPIDVYIWLTTHSPLLEWPLRNYDWLSSIKEIWPSSINPAFPMLNFDSINRNFVGLNALIKINNALTINSVCVWEGWISLHQLWGLVIASGMEELESNLHAISIFGVYNHYEIKNWGVVK